MNILDDVSMVYAVVEVWRGMVSDVHVFKDQRDAERCYDRLAADHDALQDDVQLLPVSVH